MAKSDSFPVAAAQIAAEMAHEPEDRSKWREKVRPPRPERVARRAMVLGAMGARADMERAHGESGTADAHRRLLSWLFDAGLKDEAEPQEWSFLDAHLGSLDAQQSVAASWRIEGAVVLDWALGLANIPSHDSSATPNEALTPLGFMSVDASRQVIGGARLRPDSHLYHAYNRLWQIHWRLVEYRTRPSLIDLREMERRHDWWGLLDIPDSALSAEGDLIVGGKAIGKADPQAVALTTRIAVERHLAANWLIGLGTRYSDITADT